MTIVSKCTLGPYIVGRISALAGVFSVEDADFVGSKENDGLARLKGLLSLVGKRTAV
jgi:hypothetical protein